MVAASLSTPQQALDARDTDLRLSVWIGGVLTGGANDVISASGEFDVDSVVATGKIVMPLPRPAWVVPNARVEIQAGHNDYVGTVFSGLLPRWSGAISERGRILTLSPVGWCWVLNRPERYDWEMQGPVSAASVFVALCQRK